MQLKEIFTHEIRHQLFIYKLFKRERKLRRHATVHAAIAKELISFYENLFQVYYEGYAEEEIDIITFNKDAQGAFK